MDNSMTTQDWIDFMSDPSPFDDEDYADADAFYVRQRLRRLNATEQHQGEGTTNDRTQ